MQSVLGRAMPVFAVVFTFAALFAVPASADVHHEIDYCGDQYGDCDPANNNDFFYQSSIMVERSATATGEYLWVGQMFGEGGGQVTGLAPLNNPGSDETEINPDYSEYSQQLQWPIGGLAYDPDANVIFVSDSNANRVVAWQRDRQELGDGFFLPYNPDSAAQSPYNGAMGPQPEGGDGDGEFDNPRGLAFNSFNGQLYVIDRDNCRIQTVEYSPPVNDGPPASLDFTGKFSNNEWCETIFPTDIAVDPRDGHVFVSVSDPDRVDEFTADGEFLGSIGHGFPEDVRSVAVDPVSGLLYAANGYEIDITSLATHRLLGTIDGDRFIAGESSDDVIDIDVDPFGHDLYVLTNAEDFDASGNPPAAGYSIDPPPTCTPAGPLTVAVGQSIQLPINCTDADPEPNFEYYNPSPSALGTVAAPADHSKLTYTAGAVPGSDSVKFQALTANGKSITYSQPITVIGAGGPIIRKLANLEPVSGKVFIKLPGSDVYIPLEEATLIPMGTIIDARGGHAHLTLANADGSTYEGEFWEGIFQILQGDGDNPIANIKLRDDLLGDAPKTRRAPQAGNPFDAIISRRRGKKKNGVWGNAKGKFRTSGKGGSATVGGTKWYVANFANGTYFKVDRGVVDVKTLHCPKFKLKAGHSHFQYFENLSGMKFVGKRKHPLDRGCGK